MPKENNHYVQRALLKYYTKGDGDVNFINFKEGTFYKKDAAHIFSAMNLYDCKEENIKQLEDDFCKYIEAPIGKIFSKLNKDNLGTIELTKQEQELIRKYILVQVYRNERNGEAYEKTPKGVKVFDEERKPGESGHDLWIRELLELVRLDFKDIKSSCMSSIREHSPNIIDGEIILLSTDKAFYLNELGYTMEMPPIDEKEIGKVLAKYQNDNNKEFIDQTIIKLNEYRSFDNFYFMPFGPKIAVAILHPLWAYAQYNHDLKNDLLKLIQFNVLKDNVKLPSNNIYPILKLDDKKTTLLNLYMINETKEGLIFTSKEDILEDLELYQSCQHNNVPGFKINVDKAIESVINFKNC